MMQHSCILFAYICSMTVVENILQQHQLKSTRLRKAVLSLLMMSEKGLSHQDISARLDVGFDRVTLFRTLHVFEENGILHKIIDPTGTAKYAYTAPGAGEIAHSHAHFVCLKCTEIFCLDDVLPVTQMNLPTGFSKKAIEVQVKGFCERCN